MTVKQQMLAAAIFEHTVFFNWSNHTNHNITKFP